MVDVRGVIDIVKEIYYYHFFQFLILCLCQARMGDRSIMFSICPFVVHL